VTWARHCRAHVLATTIVIGTAFMLPADTSSAEDWRGAGSHKAGHHSSSDRAKLRNHIISKQHRRGRLVDPGFGRPWPSHH